jgi:localization factor PodJL
MGADGTTDNDIGRALVCRRQPSSACRDSQFNLGILAAKGVGMPQNLEERLQVVRSSSPRPATRTPPQKRDEVAGALRPEQLENARAAAELWRAKPVDAEANAVEDPG